MAWVIDCDGVMWLGDEAIEGSAKAIEQLHSAGERTVFVTNYSGLTVGTYVEKLAGMGVKVEPSDIVTSAQAAASMIEQGSRVLVCGGDGITEALRDRGAVVVESRDCDAVVLGLSLGAEQVAMIEALNAVRGGARLIGTNDDPTYPTPDGVRPGTGALVAAVSYAAGVVADIAGKPHEPMVKLVKERVPDIEIVVGDRLSTDGLLAKRLNVPFGLVMGGVTAPDAALDPEPAIVGDNLYDLVERWLSQGRR